MSQMKCSRCRKVAFRMILLVTAALSGGCTAVLSELVAFALGAGLGRVTVPSTTEFTCYRNGVQVDCSKARRELGWKPKVSTEEGLEATVEWLRADEERRRSKRARLGRLPLPRLNLSSLRLRRGGAER